MTAERVGAAFDGAAADYDASWGTNPVGLLFRQVYQERLAALFPRGQRVFDLGCGTGEDALFLAGRGVTVAAVDASAAMIARAADKAARAGLAGAVGFHHGGIEDLDAFQPPWDGACSNFGALNCADPSAVGRGLTRLLRRGAPVVFSVMGRSPLPAVLHRALRARGAPRGDGDVQVAAISVSVRYPAVVELHEALGTAFRWGRVFALGVCVPGPGQRRWAEEHPQAFGALAALERVVRGWPGVRAWGDHVVVEGTRA